MGEGSSADAGCPPFPLIHFWTQSILKIVISFAVYPNRLTFAIYFK